MKVKTLEEITLKIGSGATPRGGQSAYKTQGISLIRSQNVYDFCFSRNGLAFIDEKQAKKLDNVTVESGDILFNITGDSIARTCIVPNEILPARVNQHVSIIRCKDDYDSKFINYYLINLKSYLLQICGVGGTRNALTKEALQKLQIRVPSTQKQIAKVLSDLDAKIEVNNKINQELEAMAKTLYEYWFVQFDFPISEAYAKQIGDLSMKGKPYKSSGGKMVYNEELKREIPEGWEVDSFSSWIKNDKSGDWGKETEQGNYVSKVSCIRGADLNGLNGKGEVKSPTRFILEKNNHKLLEVGDFIIEISGGSPTQSTGRMAFITKETLERFENPLICSNFCKAVTLKEEKALYNFAYEWNRLYDAGILFGWEGKTSGIKNLLFESFVTNHQVAIPDSKIIEQFNEKAKPIHAQIQTNLKENQKLSELRDWLLPMLMNGQVRVANPGKDQDLNKAYKQVESKLGMVAEKGDTYGN